MFTWQSPAWLPIHNRGLLWSTPRVCLDPGHFLKRQPDWKFRLERKSAIIVWDQLYPSKWLLCWRDHRLNANKSEFGPHDLGPQMWIRVIGNHRLLHATSNRWQCDHWVQRCEGDGEGQVSRCRFPWQKLFAGISLWSNLTWTRQSLLSVRSNGTENPTPTCRFVSAKWPSWA